MLFELLGSRVQKSWYAVKSVDQEEFMILTVVSKQHMNLL